MSRENKYFLLLDILLIIIFLGGCMGSMLQLTEKEKRLRYRIKQYHEYMKAGDYESTWNMFPTDDIMKRPDKDKYLIQTRTFPQLVDYQIEKIEINKNIAKIKKIVEDKLGEKVQKDLYYDYWMYQNNEWYIVDGFRTKPGGFWDQKRE